MFDCKVSQLLQYYLLNSLSTAFFRKKNRYETTYIRPSRSDLVLLEYNKIKKEYNNGDLTKDQVSNRIVILRDKTTSPDGITADNIDDLLDFSPEAIDKFEQGIKANKIQIDEQKQIIK